MVVYDCIVCWGLCNCIIATVFTVRLNDHINSFESNFEYYTADIFRSNREAIHSGVHTSQGVVDAGGVSVTPLEESKWRMLSILSIIFIQL